jgi:hypothetical protein
MAPLLQSTSTSLTTAPSVISIQKQAIDITGPGSGGGGNKVLIGRLGAVMVRRRIDIGPVLTPSSVHVQPCGAIVCVACVARHRRAAVHDE